MTDTTKLLDDVLKCKPLYWHTNYEKEILAALRFAKAMQPPQYYKIAKLCYVANGTAYFTTNNILKQWGDDWDDAPYEHNAGKPYKEAGYEIFNFEFRGEFLEPCHGHYNSPYSVEQINKGRCAWITEEYGTNSLLAGASVNDFFEFIHKCGGKVFTPLPDQALKKFEEALK